MNDNATQLTFLFDVDNTLLDNDGIIADLRAFLSREIGDKSQARYWEIFEELRRELGYADYLGAIQRYRAENPRDPHILRASLFLIDYAFPQKLFPRALDVVRHVKQWGRAAILSDGDAVFQPRKVERSGIGAAVDTVLIYIHKEEQLADVSARLPCTHYVFVDDKIRLLTAVKKIWGERVTTVWPRQGHYALDAAEVAKYPPADIAIDRIADLLQFSRERFVTKAGH